MYFKTRAFPPVPRTLLKARKTSMAALNATPSDARKSTNALFLSTITPLHHRRHRSDRHGIRTVPASGISAAWGSSPGRYPPTRATELLMSATVYITNLHQLDVSLQRGHSSVVAIQRFTLGS